MSNVIKPISTVRTYTRSVGTQRRRVSLVANARETLAAAEFGRVGTEVHITTGGQFSKVDMIEAILEITGPADVTLATWTAAEFDLSQIQAQLTSGNVKSLRLIIDGSFVTRKPQFVKAIEARFGVGSVRSTATHMKFVIIRNDDWDIAIHTSANLNFNRRLEYFSISNDAGLADHYMEIANEIFEEHDSLVMTNQRVPELNGMDTVQPKQHVKVGVAPKTGLKPKIGA